MTAGQLLDLQADDLRWAARDHTADREIVLGVARAWDDTISALVDSGGLTLARAEQALYDAIAPHCHPASRALVSMLMPRLLEALARRQGVDDGALDPSDVVPGTVWRSRHEIASEILDDELADAVRPLLEGIA